MWQALGEVTGLKGGEDGPMVHNKILGFTLAVTDSNSITISSLCDVKTYIAGWD